MVLNTVTYTLGFRKNDKPRGPNKRTLKERGILEKFLKQKINWGGGHLLEYL